MNPVSLDTLPPVPLAPLDKRSAACFFLPLGSAPHDILELAGRGGVENARRANDGYVYGHWAFFDCELWLEERPRHHLFEIQFLHNDLLDWRMLRRHTKLESLKLENDPLYSLAVAFRDACAALKPEVAFITKSRHQDAYWVRENAEQYVREGMVRTLVFDSLIVYMDNAYAKRYWDDWEWYRLEIPELIERYDVMQVEGGAIVFHGKGKGRWTGGGSD